MTNRWAWGVWAIGVFLVAGCSSSDGGGPPLSPTDFCESVGERYCAQDKPCCATAGLSFNQAACELQFTSYCLKGAGAVARGTATLVQSKLDECISKSQPYYDKCQLTNADFVALRVASTACGQFFRGTVPAAGTCTADADCESGTYGAYCQTGVCTLVLSPPAYPVVGDPCSATTCGEGLVCTADSVCAAGPPVPVVSADECAGALMF